MPLPGQIRKLNLDQNRREGVWGWVVGINHLLQKLDNEQIRRKINEVWFTQPGWKQSFTLLLLILKMAC
jgi:hypothetical protein